MSSLPFYTLQEAADLFKQHNIETSETIISRYGQNGLINLSLYVNKREAFVLYEKKIITYDEEEKTKSLGGLAELINSSNYDLLQYREVLVEALGEDSLKVKKLDKELEGIKRALKEKDRVVNENHIAKHILFYMNQWMSNIDDLFFNFKALLLLSYLPQPSPMKIKKLVCHGLCTLVNGLLNLDVDLLEDIINFSSLKIEKIKRSKFEKSPHHKKWSKTRPESFPENFQYGIEIDEYWQLWCLTEKEEDLLWIDEYFLIENGFCIDDLRISHIEFLKLKQILQCQSFHDLNYLNNIDSIADPVGSLLAFNDEIEFGLQESTRIEKVSSSNNSSEKIELPHEDNGENINPEFLKDNEIESKESNKYSELGRRGGRKYKGRIEILELAINEINKNNRQRSAFIKMLVDDYRLGSNPCREDELYESGVAADDIYVIGDEMLYTVKDDSGKSLPGKPIKICSLKSYFTTANKLLKVYAREQLFSSEVSLLDRVLEYRKNLPEGS